jgi:Ca-activated chloride channel homolog
VPALHRHHPGGLLQAGKGAGEVEVENSPPGAVDLQEGPGTTIPAFETSMSSASNRWIARATAECAPAQLETSPATAWTEVGPSPARLGTFCDLSAFFVQTALGHANRLGRRRAYWSSKRTAEERVMGIRILRGIAALLLLATMLGTVAEVRADGVIIVEPPVCDEFCPEPVLIGDQLVVRNHRVDVEIAGQIATTSIDQVFHNPHEWVAEGTYLFPVPEGATIDKFTMIVDGEPVEAKILTAEEARAIYDDIVRKMRDPALLEYVGQNVIQASIFPIGPGEDRQVQIEYEQVLTAEGGLFHYRYPLNTERFSAEPLEQVSVRVEVESDAPVRAVYSPSHDIAVDKSDDQHFVAGWEDSDVLPDTDFDLMYTVSQEAIGANIVSFWSPEDDEGTFLLLAAPGIETDQATVAKDVVIVLDTSGSMEGEKIEQAKEAVTYVLEHLKPEDRFSLVEFSTGVRFFEGELQPASEAAEAVEWVERLQATGGTDINRALLDGLAMVEDERPTYLLFMTDGLPTEGEVEVNRILENVADAAPDNVRLFAFGVGDDVDTVLLDTLVTDHHGASSYVRPGERLDETVSTFYGKISTPVLTDVELEVEGVMVEEVYPQPLPDIFAGTQLVVVGKYREGGSASVSLSGTVNGEKQTFVYDDQRFASDAATGASESLPRLWATRKIGYLLNQIRLNGENQEWIEAIIDLSVRYGIVTPYTSYLITEDDILSAGGREGAADAAFEQAMATQEPTSGEEAVEAARVSGAMQDAGAAAPASFESDEAAVRSIGDRAFLFKDGLWTETTFDPSTMETVKVQFLSDDYFRLLELHPDLAEAFALGERVIAISDRVAFEVTTEEQPPIDFEALS